jgi:hypothetical protein
MKIYVAGASANMDEIVRYMNALRDMDHVITLDWTKMIQEAGSASPDDDKTRIKSANIDLKGVMQADALWLVQPENASTGAWVELGYALGIRNLAKIKIVVSGPSKRCIFADLADYRFSSHKEALDFFSFK